jgi:imidazolonepropionase-like amidohydrolase
MKPLAAIQAGTMNGAELLGQPDQIGQIKVGCLADIIAVPGNPLADISPLTKVAFVIRGGPVIQEYARLPVCSVGFVRILGVCCRWTCVSNPC